MEEKAMEKRAQLKESLGREMGEPSQEAESSLTDFGYLRAGFVFLALP
jgi:hypothetical protein